MNFCIKYDRKSAFYHKINKFKPRAEPSAELVHFMIKIAESSKHSEIQFAMFWRLRAVFWNQPILRWNMIFTSWNMIFTSWNMIFDAYDCVLHIRNVLKPTSPVLGIVLTHSRLSIYLIILIFNLLKWFNICYIIKNQPTMTTSVQSRPLSNCSKFLQSR